MSPRPVLPASLIFCAMLDTFVEDGDRCGWEANSPGWHKSAPLVRNSVVLPLVSLNNLETFANSFVRRPADSCRVYRGDSIQVPWKFSLVTLKHPQTAFPPQRPLNCARVCIRKMVIASTACCLELAPYTHAACTPPV